MCLLRAPRKPLSGEIARTPFDATTAALAAAARGSAFQPGGGEALRLFAGTARRGSRHRHLSALHCLIDDHPGIGWLKRVAGLVPTATVDVLG
jgi:hypothetical protein